MNHREENDAGRPEPGHATDKPPVMHSFCNSEEGGDVCMTDSRTPTRLPVLDAPAECRYLRPHGGETSYTRAEAEFVLSASVSAARWRRSDSAC